MHYAIDFAKFFLKRELDTDRNTYDGNMKLQKLLFFADLISMYKTGKALFPDPIHAFANGCVVESVRLRYRNDCMALCTDSESFEPDFTQEEYDVLNLTTEIFGKLSARELSDLNHSFLFWKDAYERSQNANGYKNKDLAIVKEADILKEIDKIGVVIDNHRASKIDRSAKEIINGVTFFHSPDFIITDTIMEQLEQFSRIADENVYSIYLEDESLVIM